MSDIHGVCAALATPFDASGEQVEQGRMREHIDSLIEDGMHGLVINAGTGEFSMLREPEKSDLIDLCVKQANGRAKVIAQTSAINTVDTVEKSRAAQDMGVDAIMVLPPYFEGPGEKGVLYHYEKVARAVSIPVVLYNIPVHSGFNISPDVYRKLLAFDNIEYIKDSTADLVQLQKMIAIGGKVLSGADPLQPYALMAGCVGTIWGAANVMPRECVELYELISDEKYAEALALWDRIRAANLFFWDSGYGTEYNVAIKAACRLVGRDMGPCRKPNPPLGADARASLRIALSMLPYNPARSDRLVWRDWHEERDWLVQSYLQN